MRLVKKANTICMYCKHHNGAKLSDPWFEHICRQPDLQRQEQEDPVTGGRRWVGPVYDGHTTYFSEPEPCCREVNFGDCGFFERKKGKPCQPM